MEKLIIHFVKSLFSDRFKSLFKKYRRFNAINKLDQKMLSYVNFRNKKSTCRYTQRSWKISR